MQAMAIKVRQTTQVFENPEYRARVAVACDVPGETRHPLISAGRTSLDSLDIAYNAPDPRPEVFRIRLTSLSLPNTRAKAQSVALLGRKFTVSQLRGCLARIRT